jgi:hypothetical protein
LIAKKRPGTIAIINGQHSIQVKSESIIEFQSF